MSWLHSKLCYYPLAEALNLSAAEIHGVISFTPTLKQRPSKVVIEICQAEACHSMGAVNLKKELINYLEQSGHDVNVENVYCLGLCAQSPAIMINNKPLAKVTLDKLKTSIEGELA